MTFTLPFSLPVEAVLFNSHSFVHIYMVHTFMREKKRRNWTTLNYSLRTTVSLRTDEIRIFWHEIWQKLFLLDGKNNMPSEQQVCFLIHLNIWQGRGHLQQSSAETDVTHVWCFEPNVTNVDNTYCLTWIIRDTCLSVFPEGTSSNSHRKLVPCLILDTTRISVADHKTGVWMCIPVHRNTCTDLRAVTHTSAEKKYNA